jgi:hypothetical protein
MTSLGVGGGILSSFLPPPDLVMYARVPLLAYVSSGVGGVQHADLTWCMRAWPSPHPSIATIRQYNFQFSIIISNLNVKIEFQSKLCHHILDVGSGGVHCLDLAWHLVGGGSLAGPPPTDWVAHARYHLPTLN